MPGGQGPNPTPNPNPNPNPNDKYLGDARRQGPRRHLATTRPPRDGRSVGRATPLLSTSTATTTTPSAAATAAPAAAAMVMHEHMVMQEPMATLSL